LIGCINKGLSNPVISTFAALWNLPACGEASTPSARRTEVELRRATPNVQFPILFLPRVKKEGGNEEREGEKKKERDERGEADAATAL